MLERFAQLQFQDILCNLLQFSQPLPMEYPKPHSVHAVVTAVFRSLGPETGEFPIRKGRMVSLWAPSQGLFSSGQ